MLLDQIAEAIRHGNTAWLLGLKPEAFARASAALSGHDRNEQAMALAARHAELQLLRVDIVAAAETLSEWVSWKGSAATVRWDAVAELERDLTRRASFAKGLVLSELANLLYRTHDFHDGCRCAEKAAKHLDDTNQLANARDRVLASSQNRIWLARLRWQMNRTADARADLRAVLDTLTKEASGVSGKELGGIDLLAALALSVEAAFDWNFGNLDVARGRIFQALFLLRGQHVDDPIREGYALHTASRIETIYRSAEPSWPLRLADESVALFAKHSHPFEWRARVQRAQCLVRAGASDAAHDEIDRVTAAVDELGARLAPVEARATMEEAALIRIWIVENDARQQGMQGEAWAKSRKLSLELMQTAQGTRSEDGHRKPRRLAVDGAIHYGLALIHGCDPDRERARIILVQAEKDAVIGGHRKERIAALLALAECDQALGDSKNAMAHWDVARTLLLECENDFLSYWMSIVERGFKRRFSVVVSLDDKLDLAVKKFKQVFIAYAAALTRNTAETAELAGVDRSTVSRNRLPSRRPPKN